MVLKILEDKRVLLKVKRAILGKRHNSSAGFSLGKVNKVAKVLYVLPTIIDMVHIFYGSGASYFY